MNPLILAQLILFLAYIIYIGILPSISDSYYTLPYKQKPLFWIFLFLMGLLMLIHGGIWFSISGAGFWLVGCMEPFKHEWKFVGLLHSIGAYVLIGSALIGLAVKGNWMSGVGFLLILFVLKITKPQNETYWIEINAFAWIIVGMMIYL